jgi:hypothetical protein
MQIESMKRDVVTEREAVPRLVGPGIMGDTPIGTKGRPDVRLTRLFTSAARMLP